jgi:hypothetical protein
MGRAAEAAAAAAVVMMDGWIEDGFFRWIVSQGVMIKLPNQRRRCKRRDRSTPKRMSE